MVYPEACSAEPLGWSHEAGSHGVDISSTMSLWDSSIAVEWRLPKDINRDQNAVLVWLMITRMVEAPPGNANLDAVKHSKSSPPVTSQTQPSGGRQQSEAVQVSTTVAQMPKLTDGMTTVIDM